MKAKGATAEVFWTAFKALPKPEQAAIVPRLLKDKEFVQNLTDVALIEHARCEPSPDAVVWKNNARNKTLTPQTTEPPCYGRQYAESQS